MNQILTHSWLAGWMWARCIVNLVFSFFLDKLELTYIHDVHKVVSHWIPVSTNDFIPVEWVFYTTRWTLTASPTGRIQSTDQSWGKSCSVDDWEHHTFIVITCKQIFTRTGHSWSDSSGNALSFPPLNLRLPCTTSVPAVPYCISTGQELTIPSNASCFVGTLDPNFLSALEQVSPPCPQPSTAGSLSSAFHQQRSMQNLLQF